MPKLTKEEKHFYRFHQICLAEFAFIYMHQFYIVNNIQ